MIETFKIIHEIDKVDKNVFLEIDSGGSRCGPVGSGGVFSHTQNTVVILKMGAIYLLWRP